MMTPEQYARYEDAKHEPSDSDFLANCGLDAYGHLNWTVGNEDWMACFDAVLSPDGERVAYHVVVDCESGGFTDTIEAGVIPLSDIDRLKGLPDYWFDICADHYDDEPDLYPSEEELGKCRTAWHAYLEDLRHEG